MSMFAAITARADALNRAVRSLLQGLAVTAAVAAGTEIRSRVVAGADIADWRTLAYSAGTAALMAAGSYIARRLRREAVPIRSVQLDALVRAGRTLLVGSAVTAGAATVDAIAGALTSSGSVDVSTIALSAAGAAVAAYVHRRVLDPSALWSAAPEPL